MPPAYVAEMAPFDPLIGEYRVHYAGFFDPGFGYAEGKPPGAEAVLEVRSLDIPFILEDGQIVGRLVYDKLTEIPDQLYGQGIGSHYQAQGLKLSKHFSRVRSATSFKPSTSRRRARRTWRSADDRALLRRQRTCRHRRAPLRQGSRPSRRRDRKAAGCREGQRGGPRLCASPPCGSRHTLHHEGFCGGCPASRGDLRHLGALIHLREQREVRRIMRVDGPAPLGRQGGIACALFRLILAPAGAAGEREGEAVAREPIDAVEGLVEGSGPALFFSRALP